MANKLGVEFPRKKISIKAGATGDHEVDREIKARRVKAEYAQVPFLLLTELDGHELAVALQKEGLLNKGLKPDGLVACWTPSNTVKVWYYGQPLPARIRIPKRLRPEDRV